MNVDIDMTEVRLLAEQLAAKVREVQPEVKRILSESAAELRDKAKQSAPVDTGALQQSIAVLGGGAQHRDVGTKIRYGWYVEFGTYKDRPQPFMYPNIPPIERRMYDELWELGFPF